MLDAFRNINVELAEHASQWLSTKHVAVSVHLEVPPFCIEAVSVSFFPYTVDTKAFLKNRKSRLRDVFTSESKAARCIFMTGVNPKFWKAIQNKSNRSTERRIGRLKSIIQSKVDNKTALSLIDMKSTCARWSSTSTVHELNHRRLKNVAINTCQHVCIQFC